MAPFICPRCQREIRKPAAEGYCAVCDSYTGMCGAGRVVVCSQAVLSDWLRPCLHPGEEPWVITYRGDTTSVLLCSGHAAEVAGGKSPVTGERGSVPAARSRNA